MANNGINTGVGIGIGIIFGILLMFMCLCGGCFSLGLLGTAIDVKEQNTTSAVSEAIETSITEELAEPIEETSQPIEIDTEEDTATPEPEDEESSANASVE